MSPKTNGTKRLKVEPRSRMQKILLRWGWILPLGAIFVGGSILILTYAFASIPLPRDFNPTSSAEVYDVDGNLIGTFTDEVTRFLISEEDMDKLLKKKPFIGESVIAAEDRDFYEHNGVSLRGIARAAWANLTGGEVQQGGSTITQQYIKNAVLNDPSRTVTRKIKEAILAIKLERRFSKKQILGFYLNTIYFGRGAYGIEAASRAYFGHSSSEELKLGEMAYLAGIIPAPESYQIDDDREARDRAPRSRPGPDGARGLHHFRAGGQGEGQEAETRRDGGEHARGEVPAGRVLHGVAEEELPLPTLRQRPLHARPEDLHDDRHRVCRGRPRTRSWRASASRASLRPVSFP